MKGFSAGTGSKKTWFIGINIASISYLIALTSQRKYKHPMKFLTKW